jgi:hypothetical protein
MRFTKRGNSKQSAKCIAGHGWDTILVGTMSLSRREIQLPFAAQLQRGNKKGGQSRPSSNHRHIRRQAFRLASF